VEEACFTFRAQWQAGHRPDIAHFLARASDKDRQPLFNALLHIELKERTQMGEVPDPHSYAVRFPHLVVAESVTLLADATRSREATAAEAVHAARSATTTNGDGPPSDRTANTKREAPAHLGRYEIRRELGAGGFGAVYVGFDTQLNREVAIKTTLDSHGTGSRNVTGSWGQLVTNERFLREARRLARLKHPGIVTVYDVGIEDGQRFIVSDLVEGETLHEFMNANQVDWHEAARLTSAVADALSYAHSHRIVHRDVKPDNIVLSRDRQPILVDFGIAIDSEDTDERRGEIIGSPGYMSPEQIEGKANAIDGRTDIYSLGTIFYQLLCGTHPYPGESVTKVVSDVLNETPTPPTELVADLPPQVERICLRALARNPDLRYLDAAHLAADLQDLMRALPRTLGTGVSRPHAAQATDGTGHVEAQSRSTGSPPTWHGLDTTTGGSATGDISTPTREYRLPLLGRNAELALLEHAWHQARTGHGHVVQLCADAGLGKSRLVAALYEEAGFGGHNWALGRCSAHHVSSTLHPLMGLYGAMMGLIERDGTSDKLRKLEAFVDHCELPGNELIPLVAPILGIALGDQYAPVYLQPQRRSEMTLEALTLLAVASAEKSPRVLVIEDVHWMDPTSIDWLGGLIGEVANSGLLIILTYRPSFEPPWPTSMNTSQLRLPPLTPAHSAMLAGAAAQGRRLSTDLIGHIVNKTDGIPLFVEELTLAVLESAAHDGTDHQPELDVPIASLKIPSTLAGSLTAHLERLGPAREAAQIAAVIGGEFSVDLLRTAGEFDPSLVAQHVDTLLAAGVLTRRGIGSRARFGFRQTLLLDAAYGSLSVSSRQRWHRQVSRSLEAHLDEPEFGGPHMLAYHLNEAGLQERAVEYWHMAARRAVDRSEHIEAVAHIERALAVEVQPNAAASDTRLKLQLLLGATLVVSKGYGADDVRDAYSEALALGRELSMPSSVFQALRGLWQFHSGDGDVAEARRIGEELVELAGSSADVVDKFEAYRMLGNNEFWTGQFLAARGHMEQALALSSDAQSKEFEDRFGQDPMVANGATLAWTLCMLGYPDQALERIDTIVLRSENLGHPFTKAFAYGAAMWVHKFLDQPQEAERWATHCLDVCVGHGFAYLEVAARIIGGWARTCRDADDAPIAQMVEQVEGWRDTGSSIGVSTFLVVLAESLLIAGRPKHARKVLASRLVRKRSAAERWLESDIHRLSGIALYAMKADLDQVNTALHQAREVAVDQSARLLELRALTEIAVFDAAHEAPDGAKAALGELYGTFDEGLNSTVLETARAALSGLDEQT
jgi:predicted ATPase/serine/threonine protein kinase